MPKLLVPVDGSEHSLQVIAQVIKQAAWYQEPPEIHLLNVQPALHGDVGMFIEAGEIRGFHHDEGLKALEPARRTLDEAGLAYKYHIGVGDPAEMIVQFAHKEGCDVIILGTRGRASIAAWLMGSIATKVVHLSDLPVLFIKLTS